jgi:hypothetical protein
MLGGPLALGLGPVVISPNDLVQEAFTTEQRVEQHFGVVNLTVVQMKV